MQIIDVTLRDGGHVRNFNWPIKFAQDHYKALCKIPEIKYVELGYWKQKSKSTNPFYNLDINKVRKITQKKKLKNGRLSLLHKKLKRFSWSYAKGNSNDKNLF